MNMQVFGGGGDEVWLDVRRRGMQRGKAEARKKKGVGSNRRWTEAEGRGNEEKGEGEKQMKKESRSEASVG